MMIKLDSYLRQESITSEDDWCWGEHPHTRGLADVEQAAAAQPSFLKKMMSKLNFKSGETEGQRRWGPSKRSYLTISPQGMSPLQLAAQRGKLDRTAAAPFHAFLTLGMARVAEHSSASEGDILALSARYDAIRAELKAAHPTLSEAAVDKAAMHKLNRERCAREPPERRPLPDGACALHPDVVRVALRWEEALPEQLPGGANDEPLGLVVERLAGREES